MRYLGENGPVRTIQFTCGLPWRREVVQVPGKEP